MEHLAWFLQGVGGVVLEGFTTQLRRVDRTRLSVTPLPSPVAKKVSVALTLLVAFGYHVVRSSSYREDVERLVDGTDFVLHVRLARDAMASADLASELFAQTTSQAATKTLPEAHTATHA